MNKLLLIILTFLPLSASAQREIYFYEPDFDSSYAYHANITKRIIDIPHYSSFYSKFAKDNGIKKIIKKSITYQGNNTGVYDTAIIIELYNKDGYITEHIRQNINKRYTYQYRMKRKRIDRVIVSDERDKREVYFNKDKNVRLVNIYTNDQYDWIELEYTTFNDRKLMSSIETRSSYPHTMQVDHSMHHDTVRYGENVLCVGQKIPFINDTITIKKASELLSHPHRIPGGLRWTSTKGYYVSDKGRTFYALSPGERGQESSNFYQNFKGNHDRIFPHHQSKPNAFVLSGKWGANGELISWDMISMNEERWSREQEIYQTAKYDLPKGIYYSNNELKGNTEEDFVWRDEKGRLCTIHYLGMCTMYSYEYY